MVIVQSLSIHFDSPINEFFLILIQILMCIFRCKLLVSFGTRAFLTCSISLLISNLEGKNDVQHVGWFLELALYMIALVAGQEAESNRYIRYIGINRAIYAQQHTYVGIDQKHIINRLALDVFLAPGWSLLPV